MPGIARRSLLTIFVIILSLMTVPRFFHIHRDMAFNTIPRDDYAPYLLYLTGEKGDMVLSSPYGYRLLSVVVAIPFYLILPSYNFANLPQADPAYQRATQALAAASYVAIVASCLVIFLITRHRLRAPLFPSIMASLLAYNLFELTAMYGIDPIAIFVVGLLVYFLKQPVLFSLLIALSVGFNEKIPLMFLMLFLSRTLLHQTCKGHLLQSCSSALATGIYFALRFWVRLPGSEYQTSLTAWPASFASTLLATFTAKGAILNLMPLVAVLLMYLLAVVSTRPQDLSLYFSPADILPMFGLVLLACTVNVEYNVGRIGMYCFPLYLPTATSFIGTELLQLDKTGSCRVDRTVPPAGTRQ